MHESADRETGCLFKTEARPKSIPKKECGHPGGGVQLVKNQTDTHPERKGWGVFSKEEEHSK